MDRDTVLKHSRAVRLQHIVLPDFVELLEELCRIKAHSEHFPQLAQTLSIPGLGNEVVNAILEYFEREYHIIRIEKFQDITNLRQKQLINII